MATAKKDGEFEFPDEKQKHEVDVDAKGGDDIEIEIEVVDDTPPKDRGRKPLDKAVVDPTDEELEGYSASVNKRIKELTHARHDERRRAEALERERDELTRVTNELLTERKAITQRFNAGAEQFGKVALEGAQAALDKAKSDLRAAHEAFDTDKIVEAQEALASATLRVAQAKDYKPTPMQERKDEVKSNKPQTVEPDQKALSWQAENQWFGQAGNEDATSYALGLHQKLVNSGTDPRSDEYFEHINARMKSKFPELFDGSDEGDDDEPTPRRKTSEKKPTTVVAPATRTPAGPGKVRLTQTQVALAKKFGLTPQQYAAQVVKLQKENQNG